MRGGALPKTCYSRVRATIWLRHGRAAYLGPALRLGEHSASVHCFALGVDAPFTVHSDGAGPGRRARSALIPPRTRHRLVCGSGRVLFAYADPGSDWVARTSGRMTGQAGTPIRYDHDGESALAARLREDPEPDPLRLLDLAEDACDGQDPRVRTALALLRDDPGGRITAEHLAREVHLSASRFQHLFTAHTGTSFRRYRLWARMLRVAAALDAGKDFSTAAVAAGFASPGHFSDSFRGMFGLSATRLLTPATRIVVDAGQR